MAESQLSFRTAKLDAQVKLTEGAEARAKGYAEKILAQDDQIIGLGDDIADLLCILDRIEPRYRNLTKEQVLAEYRERLAKDSERHL